MPGQFKLTLSRQPKTNGKNGEIQLTDAIQKLFDWGLSVYAVKLDKNYAHLDVGSPERGWEALDLSYRRFCRRQTA